MIHDGGKKWIEKKYNKNFNQQTIMNFWMTKFGPYFQKSPSWSFYLLDWHPPPLLDMYLKEFSKLVAFHMDFISWLIIT
jgi:hypothetical protein